MCLSLVPRSSALHLLLSLAAVVLLLESSLAAQTASGSEEDLRAEATRLTEEAETVTGPGLGTASAEQMGEAAAKAERAARLWAQLGDLGGEARAELHRAEALHFLGSLDDARQAAERAVELSTTVGDESLEARTASILGIVETHLGDLGAAQTTLERALELHRRVGSEEGERAALHDLASVHREKKEWQSALDYQQQAADLAERLGRRLDWAGSLINLAKLYQMLGQSARAERDVERALAVARELEDQRVEAWGLRVLGDVYRQDGELRKAQEVYEKSLALRRLMGDRRSEAMVLNQLAFLQMDRDDAGSALELYRQANTIARELDDEVGVAATLGGIGEAQLALGHLAEAHATFGEELAIHEAANRWRNQAAGLASMARASLGLGQLERALREVDQALERLEASRREIADADLRAGFLEPNRRYFELAVDAHLRLHERDPDGGHLARAFEVSEQARSRTLLELVAESRLGTSGRPERASLERRRELHREIASLQRELVTASISGHAPDRGADVERRLRALEDERRRLDARLRPRLPALPPPTVTAAEAAAELGDGTVLLEFLVGAEGSVLFVADGETLHAFRLPAEPELRSLVQRVRQGLRRPSRLRQASSQQAEAELYQVLIAPAAEQLAKSREILVIPDGPLHLLPFEVLRPQPEVGSEPGYLVERWAVRYAPSMSVLASLHERDVERGPRKPRLLAFAAPLGAGAAPRPSLAVGDAMRSLLFDDGETTLTPLPYATEEARDIARLFPAAQVLVGAEASEERVKTLPALARASHLHFATHALVSDTEPDLSGLVLDPGEDRAEDGLLQVWEILDLDLSAELVVLSACETGLGREVRGEGIIGLSRAFFYAGASSLLASLWRVDDRSTHDLMVRFYTHLRKRPGDAAQALRRAKLELISDGYSHPFYWAPFVLVGVEAGGD